MYTTTDRFRHLPIKRMRSEDAVVICGILSARQSFCGICATTTPVSWRSLSAAFIPSASGLIVGSPRFRVAFIWTSVFGIDATGWRTTIRLNIEPQGRRGFQKKSVLWSLRFVMGFKERFHFWSVKKIKITFWKKKQHYCWNKAAPSDFDGNIF